MAFMVAGWVLAGLIAAPICTADHSILGGLTEKQITLASGLTFSQTGMALPLMATGMLLPFVFFFVFAGPSALLFGVATLDK